MIILIFLAIALAVSGLWATRRAHEILGEARKLNADTRQKIAAWNEAIDRLGKVR